MSTKQCRCGHRVGWVKLSSSELRLWEKIGICFDDYCGHCIVRQRTHFFWSAFRDPILAGKKMQSWKDSYFSVAVADSPSDSTPTSPVYTRFGI